LKYVPRFCVGAICHVISRMRNDVFLTRVKLNSLNISSERKFAVIGTILAGLVDLMGGYCTLVPLRVCGSPFVR